MTKYTVTFSTAHAWAMTDIKARTAKQALKEAYALYDEDPVALDWYPYDPDYRQLEEIEIESPKGQEKGWQSEDLTLRLAAQDLLDALEPQTDAAQAVIDAWETGDLTGAVHTLKGFIPAAQAAIATAKGGGCAMSAPFIEMEGRRLRCEEPAELAAH
jgi:hypothetical protein